MDPEQVNPDHDPGDGGQAPEPAIPIPPPLMPMPRRIPTLPDEMLERLFHLMDGRSLLGVLKTCTHFREVLSKLERTYSIWFTCCKREMSPSEMRDIRYMRIHNKLRHLPESERNLPAEWKEAYKCWTKFCDEYPVELTETGTVSYSAEPCHGGSWPSLNVVAITGQCILIGCNDGAIILHSLTDGEHCVIFRAPLSSPITHLYALNPPGTALPPQQQGDWSLAAHDYVLSASRRGQISVTRILPSGITSLWAHPERCRSVMRHESESRSVTDLAVSEPYFAASMKGKAVPSEIHVWKFTTPSLPRDQLRADLVHVIRFPHGHARGNWTRIGFTPEQTIMAFADNLWLWKFGDDFATEAGSPDVIDTVRHDDETRFYFLRESVFALLQNGGSDLYLKFGDTSVDGVMDYIQHDPLVKFNSEVTAVTLNYGVLLFGTAQGRLYLYKVPSSLDGFSFSLDAYSWTHQLQPLRRVNSVAVSLGERGLLIAAAQAAKVTLFRTEIQEQE